MKLFYYVFPFLLFINLIGCSSDNNAKNFSVTLSGPKNVVAGEKINFEAILTNNSNVNYEILHSGNLFGISIVKEDEEFADMVFEGSLVRSKINANNSITEKHAFAFDSPGTYKVIAKAKFEMGKMDDKDNQQFYMDTNILRVEVE